MVLQGVFVLVLVQVIFFDLEHGLILDRVMLPAALFALAVSVLRQPWWAGTAAGLVAAGALLLLGGVGSLLARRDALGLGDVKLAAVIGLMLGPERTAEAMVTGFIGAGAAAIGIAAWLLLVPAALLVRRAPVAAGEGARGDAAAERRIPVKEALTSTPFIVLAATFFACCATHAGPIFHTISYALVCGIPTVAAVSIYSLEGLAGLGGRVVFGLMGDRYGAKRVLIGGLFIQALAAGSFMFANRLGEFYAVAAVFGFAYGGVMPLYAVLARDYFGQAIMGTVLGAAAMVSSLGMAIGPWIGGWLFDTFGSYAPMYVYSFAIGLGAAAIALAFPPPMMRPVVEFAR